MNVSRARAPWKCRAVESMESQKQASHTSHSAWKSLSRFPHFHRADEAWKSGKPKPGFPLSHLLFMIEYQGCSGIEVLPMSPV